MRSSAFATLALLPLLATVGFAQSLGELAAKEKERREKNKGRGKSVRVITDSDLRQGEEADRPTEESGTPPAPASSPRRPTSSRPPVEGEETEESDDRGERTTEIPREGPLESRIRIFQAVKKDYEQEVAKIDQEIAKNNARLIEIEQKLASLGAGGLPIAPQPDAASRYDGEFFGLMDEKGKLQARSQELTAKKQSLWQELAEKARRAGIPPGYLRK